MIEIDARAENLAVGCDCPCLRYEAEDPTRLRPFSGQFFGSFSLEVSVTFCDLVTNRN